MNIKIKLIFGMILFLFVFLALMAFLNLRHYQNTTNSIDHSHQIIHSLQKVYSDLKTTQADYAEYLLTQKPVDASTCKKEMKEIEKESKRAQDLISGDPLLEKKMYDLQTLLDKKISSMQAGLSDASAGNASMVIKNLQEEHEKKINEEIKSLVDEMSGIQIWLLKTGKLFDVAETQKNSHFLIGGAFSAFVFCIMAGFFINRQINDRQTALNKLKSSEEKFRFLAETANDSFIITDSKGAITDINPAGETIFGYSKSELIGRPLTWLMSPQTNPGSNILSFEKFLSIVSGVQFLEISGIRKDGSFFPLEISVSKWETMEGTFYTTFSRDISERKFFIKTLLNNEKTLFQFLDAIPLSILVRDPTGFPYYSNQAAHELLGMDFTKNKLPLDQTPQIHQLYITGTDELYPSDQLPSARAIKGEKVHVDNIEIHRLNGRIPLEAWGSPIFDEHEKLNFTLTTLMDVSHQREIHKATKEREEFFRNLFEESPIGMTISSPDGVLVNINRSFEEMLGYNKNEFLNRSFLEFIFEDDVSIEKAMNEKLFNNTLPKYQMEVRYLTQKKELLWCNVSASVIRDVQNKPLFRIAIVENITEQKMTQIELMESSEKFRILTESANDAIVSVDSKGKIIFFNHASEKVFDYTQKEILGQPFPILMEETSWKANTQLIENYLSTGKSTIPGRTMELEGKRKNGETFPAELSYFSWKTEKGLFFTSIIRDITWRKQIEEMKNDLISVVSHQLKTPVAEINGYIENMLDGITGDLSTRQREYLSEMREIGNENYRLISDLLNLSKIERGVMTVELTSVRLNEIMEMALRDQESKIKKKNLSLDILHPTNEIWVIADKNKTVEALRNIIDNAIKCTDQGTIQIRPFQNNPNAGFEVSDTGIGMNESTIQQLFTKTQVLGSEASRSGAGLGLFIAKNFMNLQNGDITVTSELGKGSTFCLTIPLMKTTGG